MPELTMPRLSDTMQEGTLARWLKQPGERVEKGEIVAEIETDKATMELESYDSGVLQEILVPEGQTVPIGQAIAIVGTGEGATEQRADGGNGAAATAEVREQTAEAAQQTGAPPDRQGPAAEAIPEAQPPAADQQPVEPAVPQPRPERAVAEAAGDQVKASPMARAIARDHGIDLRAIQGSGPGGRIIRTDVEAAISGDGRAETATTTAPAEPRATAPAAPAAADDVEEIALTGMRRAVARRMLESTQNIPHFYLTRSVDAEALIAFRADLNQRLAASGDDLKLSLNDLLIKACATAIRSNPDVNVSWAGDKILRHRRVNIGVAVALDQGLIVPVIRDADQKSLGQIAREAKALAEKARDGKLQPAEFSGGTFTISNLGMFGVEHFTAVINPPEAAILAVGAAIPEAVVREGQIAVRQTMRVTLSIDHRVLDGATGARFLQQLKDVLEEPLRIVV